LICYNGLLVGVFIIWLYDYLLSRNFGKVFALKQEMVDYIFGVMLNSMQIKERLADRITVIHTALYSVVTV